MLELARYFHFFRISFYFEIARFFVSHYEIIYDSSKSAFFSCLLPSLVLLAGKIFTQSVVIVSVLQN